MKINSLRCVPNDWRTGEDGTSLLLLLEWRICFWRTEDVQREKVKSMKKCVEKGLSSLSFYS